MPRASGSRILPLDAAPWPAAAPGMGRMDW